MRFSSPQWLAAAPVAWLLLAWLWYRYDLRQRSALARFVSGNLRLKLTRSISVGKRRLQRGTFLLSATLLCVALAGPQLGYRWEKINRRGNEIVFALDTSRSMSTPDIKPDRLTRAKLAIDDFVRELDGDAVGIVAFAGSAFLVCPITLDYSAFHESLNAIDTHTIPRGGTNISSAIREAELALRRRPGSDKILVLITDGEDLEGSALSAARTATQDDGLKIYTVGVGSAAGDLIPLPAEQGGGFVKDDTGAYVKSRLDEKALQDIASATGGFYVPLGTQGEGLQTIFTNVLGPMAKHDLASRQQKIYTERYQWPLAASLASLLLSLIIGTRRRTRMPKSPSGSAAAVSSAIVTLAMVMIASPPPRAADVGAGSVQSPAAAGAPAPTAPAPTAATPASTTAAVATPSPAAVSQDAKAPIVAFNAGTAAYRAGEYSRAMQAFQSSISTAPSSDAKRLATQEDAYYNLGNTLYRAGQKTEQSAPQDTLRQWNDAVKAYETALQMRSNDADSKYNRDLVKRKIEALKQQQEQNKDPQKNQGQGQGQGQGKGQGQGSAQGQSQGGPKDKDQPPKDGANKGESPPGQQQPAPDSAKNDAQAPRQQPPAGQQPGGQQPPPGQQQGQQQPPPGQQPGQQPPPGQQPGQQPSPPSKAQSDPNAPKNDQPAQGAGGGAPPADGDPQQDAQDTAQAADNQHAPGQMSREEARELLDSVKGDEQRGLRAPLSRRDGDDTPDKPLKDW